MRSRLFGGSSFPAVEGRTSDDDDDDSSSCSSSIGINSDEESESECEVETSFKGPLDTMKDLQEVLPTKRGISNFYTGKSRSFTSIADATSASSIKDLAKPENPYSRKPKNNYNRRHRPKDSDIKRPSCNRSNISSSPSSCLPPLHPQGKISPIEPPCSPPLRRNSN